MKAKTIFVNLLLIIIGTLIGFFLCELGLRLYYFGSLKEPMPESHLRQPHKTLGWCLRSNETAFEQTLDYSVRVRINSKGLRDVEHNYEKEDGIFRIVILGDSFMEAYQVPLEKSFPRLLEKTLNEKLAKKVEVINLGVGGYGTAQEYLYLKEEGLRYKPDLVILAFLGCNDVRNNSRLLETKLWRREDIFKVAGRPFYSVDDQGNLSLRTPDFEKALKFANKRDSEFKKKADKRDFQDKVLLYRILRAKVKSITADVRYRSYDLNAMLGAYFPSYDKNWEEAWNITKRIILMTHEISLRHGACFLLVTVPAKFQVENEYFDRAMSKYLRKAPDLKIDLEKPESILRNFCEENKIHFLSLLKGFREHYAEKNKKLYYSIVDTHWNKQGHELASEIIADYLIAKKIL